ncbi:MAG: PfkB family carbohydrate kinase [Nitriliruptorales bacterium]
MGAGGVFVATSDGDRRRLRTPTVTVRSRIGAGDSMVGGIVAGLSRGLEVQDAVRLGLAAGAATVTMPGSQLGQGEDVEALFSRMREQD